MGLLFPAGGSVSYSRQVVIELWCTPKAATGTWTGDFSTLAWVRVSDGAQNDSITFDFACEAGTYNLDIVHEQGPNRGIYTVAVDGSTVSTIDGYNPAFFTSFSLTYASISTVTGIVLSAGRHTISFTMATKNASSSNYYGAVSRAVLTQTA